MALGEDDAWTRYLGREGGIAIRLYNVQIQTRPELGSRLALASLIERRLVFSVTALAYLAAAVLLVFVGNVILGDALARVENIHRVIYSRDPHLAAIGFNFPPLPQFFYLPFVPLQALWPPIVKYGFIGNTYSAAFMAGAVVQLHELLHELGVRRVARLTLTALFALHPMVFYSGANGMTEAASLFFLLLATVQLMRWLKTRSVTAQVLTGLALGLAFLTRYETMFSGLAVMGFVAVMTYRRQTGAGRLTAGLCDAVILGGPFLMAVVGWIVANWVIAGSPLAEVTNAYGTAQLHIAVTGKVEGLGRWERGLQGMLTMEPLLPGLVLLGTILAVLHRRSDFAPPLMIFAPILAFMEWSWGTGTILDSLRYVISAVPIATLMGGVLLAPTGYGSPPLLDRRRSRHRFARAVTIVQPYFLVSVALLAAVPVAAKGMWEQQGSGASALMTVFDPKNASEAEERAKRRWTTDREVAGYLDGQHLRRGAVLVDDFAGFAIFLSSSNPDQFVIASDRDFQAALVDPAGAGVQYILVPQPKDILVLEAVNRTYPDFYENGAGIGELVKEFPQASDGPVWRLYQVKGQA